MEWKVGAVHTYFLLAPTSVEDSRKLTY